MKKSAMLLRKLPHY